jgi:hypothetical protein
MHNREALILTVPYLHPREDMPATESTIPANCATVDDDHIMISRSTLIITLTIAVFIVCVSILGLSVMLYREWHRQKQNRNARVQGRKSRYLHRISVMRKEVDDSFSRQYTGCLQVEPDNPFLQPRSPVELMYEERVCEVPALPAATAVDQSRRKSRISSLMYDATKGLWFHR